MVICKPIVVAAGENAAAKPEQIMTNNPLPPQEHKTKPLSVGFLLAPDFTLSAFANFVDALRLAADDGDFSRQIRCKWQVLSDSRQAIRSSCGIEIFPTAGLLEPSSFDYLVLVGGLLHSGKSFSPILMDYLKKAAAQNIPLVGVCTGSFILARAKLMNGYKTCVSWFHHQQFELEFPSLNVYSDRLFINDGNRITCAGAAGVMNMAASIIEKHCGKHEASRALRIMLEEFPLSDKAPQPQSFVQTKITNINVHRAILLIERNISTPLPVEAMASQLNISHRHLERLFQREMGVSPAAFSTTIRIKHAKNLLLNTSMPVLSVAMECGFVDASHFSRRFKTEFGKTPTEMRKEALLFQ